MTAQRVFGALFLMLGIGLLAMGVNPIRFIGPFHGTLASGTSDLSTYFYLPGVVTCVLGCFLMLFGPGGRRA